MDDITTVVGDVVKFYWESDSVTMIVTERDGPVLYGDRVTVRTTSSDEVEGVLEREYTTCQITPERCIAIENYGSADEYDLFD